LSEEKAGLGLASTIAELFEFARPDEGTRVVPISMPPRDDDRADYLILITGSADECKVVMTNLMTFVNNMYQAAEKYAEEQLAEEQLAESLDNEPTVVIS
jgi:hypothetical protein